MSSDVPFWIAVALISLVLAMPLLLLVLGLCRAAARGNAPSDDEEEE